MYVCVPQCHGLHASKQSRTLNTEELMRQPDIPMAKHTRTHMHTPTQSLSSETSGRCVHAAAMRPSAAAKRDSGVPSDWHIRLLRSSACLGFEKFQLALASRLRNIVACFVLKLAHVRWGETPTVEMFWVCCSEAAQRLMGSALAVTTSNQLTVTASRLPKYHTPHDAFGLLLLNYFSSLKCFKIFSAVTQQSYNITLII